MLKFSIEHILYGSPPPLSPMSVTIDDDHSNSPPPVLSPILDESNCGESSVVGHLIFLLVNKIMEKMKKTLFINFNK